jgi:carbamoyl-phosphate synthase large subunit
MKTIQILFLGASKRVSLIERFLITANKLGIDLRIFSCEIRLDFFPISHLSTIIRGPDFQSPSFKNWLKKITLKHSIDIVIPLIDSATVALSKLNTEKNLLSKIKMVVSSKELCISMEDKILAEKFFLNKKIPIPNNTPSIFPKIAKYRHGYGGKNCHIITDESSYNNFFKKKDFSDYIVQDYMNGYKETTVDFFVNKEQKLIGYVLRDRLSVSDGEVMECITRKPNLKEKNLIESIASIPGWYGCITLQFFKKNKEILVLEINPRFGGGATASIEAGLDMPKYILCEYMKDKVDIPKNFKKLRMCRARRDFFNEI